MMYLSVLICALLSVLVSSTPYAEQQHFALNATNGANVFIFQTNLKQGTSNLAVESTVDLIFCFQEQYALYGPLNNTPVINTNPVYWGHRGVCTYVVNTTAGTNNYAVPLSMVPHAVAVYFQNFNSSVYNFTHVNFTLGTAGDSCPNTQIYVPSGTCENFQDIGNNIAVIDAAADKLSVFRFHLSQTNVTGRFIVGCHDNTTQLKYWFQRDNTPVIGGQMGECPGPSITVDMPRNGLTGYYLLIENTRNVSQILNFDTIVCGDNQGGPDCGTHVRNATTISQLVLNMSDIYYFKIEATKDVPVWISTRRTNKTQLFVVNPLIFASRNQLPTRANADIGGCTQYFCDLVHVIHFNVSDNQTWYIGIQNSADILNGTTAGVWFNSICAPDCQDHGTCADTGPQIGYCDCIDGFIGVDCQQPNGFGPQFIVLIIIAVLVALTAVIGFGAWAYMRRKRGQYDIVS